jgi:putative membrane protein
MSEPRSAAPKPSAEALTQTHFSWLRTRLSVERTFMSWTRTATSLIGFGFTIYQFLRSLERAGERPAEPRLLGLAFIATGVLTMAIGTWQRQVELGHLGRPEYRSIAWQDGAPSWRWSNVVAFVVIAIGLVAFGWIVGNS